MNWKEPQYADTLQDQEMVYIPGGTFWMGTPVEVVDALEREQAHPRAWFEDEMPMHAVQLAPYWIDRYPVTNLQFEIFTKETKYQTVAERRGWGLVYTESYWEEVPGASWFYPTGSGRSIVDRPDHPAVQIAWEDALAYATWAGKRLPSESEWELAARGYSFRKWPWGDTWEPLLVNTVDRWAGHSINDIGVWKQWWSARPANALPDTMPVGMLGEQSASPFGIYDMAGNVYEWTSSHYKLYGAENPYDNIYEFISGKYLVVRGGSWMSFRHQVRCSERMATTPNGYTNFAFGFRCARDAT